MIPEKQLAEIEARKSATTDSQWIEGGLVIRSDRGTICTSPTPPNGGVFDCAQNIRFIAHAHADVPALTQSLREAMEALRATDFHGENCAAVRIVGYSGNSRCDCGRDKRRAFLATFDAAPSPAGGQGKEPGK